MDYKLAYPHFSTNVQKISKMRHFDRICLGIVTVCCLLLIWKFHTVVVEVNEQKTVMMLKYISPQINLLGFSDSVEFIEAEKGRNKEKYVFVIVMCVRKKEDRVLEESFEVAIRNFVDKYVKVEQTFTAIKSALALTKKILRFVIISDSLQAFDNLQGMITEAFPVELRSRLILQYMSAAYPKKGKHMQSLDGNCGAQPIFLQYMLPLDSVIYLDSDILFLRPPEDLWAKFDEFKDENMMGMAPFLSTYYEKSSKVPFYGASGLNSGVILMNMTRMDTFPGGWVDWILKAYEENKESLGCGAQDLFNIAFNRFPSLVYELSCDWNFVSNTCFDDGKYCSKASTDGISLLHGNEDSFRSKLPHFKAVSEAWKKHSLTRPVSYMVHGLELKLQKIDSSECLYNNISYMLLKRLKE